MRAELRGTVSYRRLFAVPGFAQLAAGTVLARTAGTLWQVALVLFVLNRYHSATLAGVAAFLSIAPGLAVSPIAGALLDRQGRLRMIRLDYAVGATALVLLGGLELADRLGPAALLAIVAAGSLTAPLSGSGVRSLFPLFVPRELWDRANGVDSGSQAVATVLGPALAGLLVAWVGGAGAFLATAALLVCAMVALVGIAEPAAPRAEAAPLLRAAWQGLVFVLRHATLRGIMLTLFTGNIGFGILTVAVPVLVFGRFHSGAAAVGELWSVAGVATVASTLLAGRIDTRGRERPLMAWGWALAAAGCVVLALAGAAPALALAMALVGLSSGPIDIGLFALRQRRTDPRWFGRAFAVSMSLNFAGQPIGSALGGPVVERSVALALGVAAAFSLAAGAVAYALIPRDDVARDDVARDDVAEAVPRAGTGLP